MATPSSPAQDKIAPAAKARFLGIEIMLFSDAVAGFLEQLGIADTTADTDGSHTVVFDEVHEITFVPDPEDHAVFFYALMGDAGLEDAAMLRLLLESSLLGSKTDGAAFSLDPNLRQVIMWKRFDDNFVSADSFSEAVRAFLAQVIFWKDELHKFQVKASESGSLPLPEQLLS